MTLRFHAETFALLPSRPSISESSVKLLTDRERSLGIRFPESVQEFYSLEGAVELLRRYSNDDQPCPLERLGEPWEDWYGAGRRDFVSQGLLWIMTENQGVCNWAVMLDGSNDPPVVVEVDSAPYETWQSFATSFSVFIYCQVWDHVGRGVSCSAQEQSLRQADLDFLKNEFDRRPKTFGWPGNTNYRFESKYGRVLLWDGQERGTDWFVSADDVEHLAQLLRQLWHCGNLSSTLYGIDREAERILAEIRKF